LYNAKLATLAAIIFSGGRNFAVRRIFGYPHFFPADFRPAIIFRRIQLKFGGWGLPITDNLFHQLANHSAFCCSVPEIIFSTLPVLNV